MICNICRRDKPIYKDNEGKAINAIILEKVPYMYCSQCIRKMLRSNLAAKLHPIVNNGMSSKTMIETGEQFLRGIQDD